MRWRVGRPSVVDGGRLNLEDCCRYDQSSADFGIWHAGWNRQRCCISLDLAGFTGAPVFASGYNESPVAVEIKARKATEDGRCIVWLYSGSNPPDAVTSTSPSCGWSSSTFEAPDGTLEDSTHRGGRS